ncbi:MAG: hypothetical protein HOI66_09830 [Verrucomicrobia bacterium]|jgi:hypothetical protein|nr:hypothetical protein [Verrucomicrobiota bacterium]MDA7667428.1 hypothetical protein [bacterium]
MDDAENSPGSGGEGLEPRGPSVEDLVELCRILNGLEARYVVVGGFAVRGAGFNRMTMDIDLIIDTSLENEAKVYRSLESLPDQAVSELVRGDVEKYTVVRVVDEIVVDLMKSACGIEYEEASKDVVIRELDGVLIPFASPRLLWRMKANTHREKDALDLVFLQEYFDARGEKPPVI